MINGIKTISTTARTAAWSGVFAVALVSWCLGGWSVLKADTYPTEVWPSNATITALNGTTDSPTGLPYPSTGTNPQSAVPLQIQIDRLFNRLFGIAAQSNQLKVVQTDTLRVGVFPGDYMLGSTLKTFSGATDQGSGTLDAGDDTYLVYLDSSNALQIVDDGTGWPGSIDQYVPLAAVTVADSAITGIVDRRGWSRCRIGGSGAGGSATGTDETVFTLDEDNSGAGADSTFAANRGSTDAHDAGLRWDESNDQWDVLEDVTDSGYCPIKASTLVSTIATGTAPLIVASTTKITNLNADAVDGVSWTAPAAANGLAYSTGTADAAFTAAPTAGDVVYADGSGVPTWAAPGATSGVEPYDADLVAVAGLGSNGMIARTGTGTAAVRTITAGTGISVSSGDGVSGNPTVSLAATTNHAMQVGNSSGGLTSLTVGADNTVLVGQTGSDPTFRKINNDDISSSAGIEVNKLEDNGTFGQILILNYGGARWASMFQINNMSADDSLNSYDTLNWYTNNGSSGDIVLTLPAAYQGYAFGFVVYSANYLKIQAQSGDYIYLGATQSASGGYIRCNTVGCMVWVLAINPARWIVISYTGTWTVDS